MQQAGIDSHTPRFRILILGGGFGGVYTARHLEKLCKGRSDVEIVLVSRDNFLVMTPLLFEVCSGTLDLRHCSFPIRAFLRGTQFGEAIVERIDLERRVVHVAAHGQDDELTYDHLVVALGAMTNQKMIPGSENAFTFKTLADAFLLRNHIIEPLRASRRRARPRGASVDCSRFVVIGGGLVGVELFGELTAFVDEDRGFLYSTREPRRGPFPLTQGATGSCPRSTPSWRSMGPGARWPARAEIRTQAPVRAIEPGKVHLADETIEAETIVLAAGIVPNPVVAALPVEKDQLRAHRGRWDHALQEPPGGLALGDCAFIPSPDGKPYPNLAQHALREAKVLARNIHGVLNGQSPRPFVYTTLGMMGSLGHSRAFGQLLKVRVHGVVAWFVRRMYYLLQMPGWSRRLRIMIDWTFAFLFRPDIVKISLDSETVSLLREAAAGAVPAHGRTEASYASDQPSPAGVTAPRAEVHGT